MTTCVWLERRLLRALVLVAATQALVPNALMAQLTSSPSSLSFGDRQVGSLSPGQGILVNPVSYTDVVTYTLSGPDAGDFIQANSGSYDTPQVAVAFQPRFPGTKSASLTITDTTANTSLVIPLTGNAVLTGTFHIVASFSGKVLDLGGDSDADLTPIEQHSLDGLPQQGWRFVPTDNDYYQIVNSVTGKVLDVTDASTEDGARIQEYGYWGGLNQQWQITPVDDVHYQIVNRLSGKSLDVTDGSTSDGTPIQQWTYVGDGQQLWAIIPANPYSIANTWSGDVLDVLDGSTENQAMIQQWSPNGNRQQQWEFMPVSSGYYAILNRMSGKALDDTDASTSGGTLMQQYDYLGGTNQQWQLVPQMAFGTHGFLEGNTLVFTIVNRLSGMVLDDTDQSTSNGTFIQQWPYTGQNGFGAANQVWQLVPITAYNIQNSYSNMVLDVPGGTTASGALIQQWTPNGYPQQAWQIIPLPEQLIAPYLYPETLPANCIISNLLTGKVLDVVGGSTLNLAQIDQSDFEGSLSQLWSVMTVSSSTALYQVVNQNSQKALDDTNASTSNGTIMQQYVYWGGLNQQWQFVPQE